MTETTTLGPGLHALSLNAACDALLYVPGTEPRRLVVAFHGSGSTPSAGIEPLIARADDAGLVLLAPRSRRSTWDLIAEGDFGADLAALEELIAHVFARVEMQAPRVAAAGFSDGASYALSLALNRRGFEEVLAFSPGFVVRTRGGPRPRVFVAHGTEDVVLPIDRCSRRIVGDLRRAGLDVTYEEFDGAHTVPEPIAQAAVSWLG